MWELMHGAEHCNSCITGTVLSTWNRIYLSRFSQSMIIYLNPFSAMGDFRHPLKYRWDVSVVTYLVPSTKWHHPLVSYVIILEDLSLRFISLVMLMKLSVQRHACFYPLWAILACFNFVVTSCIPKSIWVNYLIAKHIYTFFLPNCKWVPTIVIPSHWLWYL